jgi:deoxyhypusine synthase
MTEKTWGTVNAVQVIPWKDYILPTDPDAVLGPSEARTSLDDCLDEAERARVIAFALRSLNQRHQERMAQADSLEDGIPVRGYDHEGPFCIERFLAGLETTGFQATHLARAIHILREVRDRGVPLYLGFTSNIGTCGLRETLAYLTRHRHMRALATTAGAVEEDVMKVFDPFVLGDFRTDGKALYNRAINRSGNIFIPSSHYTRLHLLLWLLNKRLWRSFVQPNGHVGSLAYTHELGRQLELLALPRREESFVYWAFRNHIPLHCPGLLDGALGDGLYYFEREFGKPFVLDVMDSARGLIDEMIVAGSTRGAVALLVIGGSLPKHMLCNAAIFCGGARYAVYVNTATEADGSNAGAPIDEAVTWGKIQPDAAAVKVEGEATLVVPLLVAGAFQEYTPQPAEPQAAGKAPHPDSIVSSAAGAYETGASCHEREEER